MNIPSNQSEEGKKRIEELDFQGSVHSPNDNFSSCLYR